MHYKDAHPIHGVKFDRYKNNSQHHLYVLKGEKLSKNVQKFYKKIWNRKNLDAFAGNVIQNDWRKMSTIFLMAKHEQNKNLSTKRVF